MLLGMASATSTENLGARAQNLQLRMGLGLVSLGLLAAVAMNHFGASGPMHVVLIPVFFAGVYGLAAGLAGTCTFCAVFGRRATESGTEPIADRCELAAVRRRGAWLVATTLLVSLAAWLLLALAH
jgi:hypothetical protein